MYRLTIISISCFIIGTCSKPTDTSPVEPQSSVSEIPDSIVSKGDAIIIAKAGWPFFSKYVHFDQAQSHFYEADTFCIAHPSSCADFLRNPYYLMVYSVTCSEKPYVKGLIEFVLDSTGTFIPERPLYGVPDCLSDSLNCTFSIDSVMAVQIATEAGLEPGIRPWRTQFSWHGRHSVFVWSVSNTLADTPYFSGRTAAIDAGRGIVLEIGGWMAIP